MNCTGSFLICDVWNDGNQVCLCRLYVYNKTVAFMYITKMSLMKYSTICVVFPKKLTYELHWFIFWSVMYEMMATRYVYDDFMYITRLWLLKYSTICVVFLKNTH